MRAFITPIPFSVCSSHSHGRCSRPRRMPDRCITRRVIVACNEPQQPENLEDIRALLTSEGKAEQQKGLLLVRNIQPEAALELLLLSVRTSKNDFIRASATIAIGDLNFKGDRRTLMNAVSALVDLLATADDYSIRSAAAAGIGYIAGADGAVVATLQEALNRALIEDLEWQVHFSCLAALGNLRDGRAVQTLLRWVPHENDLLVQAAVGALGDIGDEIAVPELLKVLGSDDMMTRQRLAQALGRMERCAGEPAVIDALRTLSKDQSIAVREAAMEALRSFGCTSAVKVDVKSDEELIDIEVANLMEGNEVGNAGESASYALRRRLERSFDKEYIDQHWHKSDQLTRQSDAADGAPSVTDVVEASSSVKDEETEDEDVITDAALYKSVLNDLKYGSSSRKVLAAIRLRKFDPKLGLQAVKDSNALDVNTSSVRLRAVCVKLLARGRAIDMIINVLQNDTEENVRSACCDALMENNGDAVSIRACIKAFETDEHWLVRISAAIALGTIGKGVGDVEASLISSLQSDGVRGLPPPQDSVVRRHAITALGFLGSVNALQAFKMLLEGGVAETAVRSRLAAALRGIPSNESVALLKSLIDDEDDEVSEMAQGSLDALANQGMR